MMRVPEHITKGTGVDGDLAQKTSLRSVSDRGINEQERERRRDEHYKFQTGTEESMGARAWWSYLSYRAVAG